MSNLERDKIRIARLGGPTKVAELLHFDKEGGVQRVQNWLTRGIPAQVKLDNPSLFLVDLPEVTTVSSSDRPIGGSASPTSEPLIKLMSPQAPRNVAKGG